MKPSNRNLELNETIEGLLRGDTSTYHSVRARIESYVRDQLYDYSEFADIVDEILQILFENLSAGKFQGDSLRALNVYILGITKNHVRRHITVRKRIKYTSDDLDVPDKKSQPNVESEDLARKVIASLGGPCGDMLELKFIRGWSDEEIAQKVGKTKNATSTAIHRCLQRARELPFIKELL